MASNNQGGASEGGDDSDTWIEGPFRPMHPMEDPNFLRNILQGDGGAPPPGSRLASLIPGRTASSGAKVVQLQPPKPRSVYARRKHSEVFDPAAVRQRARALGVPPHLVLGISVGGIEAWMRNEMPRDALELANAAIPRLPRKKGKAAKKDGKLKYPRQDTVNGYVSQWHLLQASKKDGLSQCERVQAKQQQEQQQQQAAGSASADGGGGSSSGSSGSSSEDTTLMVGTADVFVSWHLGTPLVVLISALRQYLANRNLPMSTKFWVCSFSMRSNAAPEALQRLGACVEMIKHTAVVLEPWRTSSALKRTYCIKEIYHTHKCGGSLGVTWSARQQTLFFRSVMSENCSRFIEDVARVDARTAESRDKDEQRSILRELDAHLGLLQCSQVVTDVVLKALCAEALEVLNAAPSRENDDTSLIGTNRTWLLQASGNFAAARPFLEQSLAMYRKTLGNKHRSTLITMNNLTMILQDTGDYKGARDLLEESLALHKEVLGETDEMTLIVMQHLSIVLRRLGDVPRAIDLGRQAQEGRRKSLGPHHPDTLTSTEDIALLLHEQGHYETAQPYYRELVAARRQLLGDTHPETLSAIVHLGSLLRELKDLSGACALLEEAVAGLRRQRNLQRKPELPEALSCLGLIYRDQGQLARAKPVLEECLAKFRELQSNRHPHTIYAMGVLGALLKDMGKLREAKALLEEQLVAARDSLGNMHETTLTAINTVGKLRSELGDLEGAKPLYEEFVEAMRQTYGEAHEHTLVAIDNMANMLQSMGKRDAAKSLFQESLAGWRETVGDKDPHTLTAIRSLGVLLVLMGNYAESLPLFQEHLDALLEQHPRDHTEVRLSADNLFCALQQLGDVEEAERVRAEYGL